MAKTIDVKVIIDAVDNASKTFDSLGSSLDSVGNKLTLLGAGATAALGLSIKSAIDFESSFAGIRKTVDASEAEFKALESNIRNIAKAAPVSTTELNKIGEMAGQLGVRGTDNLTKFIDTISKMAVTTNLTSDEAATSFARIANIMQEPIQNIDRMGSTVVDLGNNFATTESEIVGFANRIAGAGKIAGLTTSDIFGIGAAMSSVGVEAEAGGTAVQKVLLSMNQAVVQGNGDLATFAKTAGVSAADFKKAWEQDAGAAFSDFVMGLGKQGDDAINTLSELGLEDQRLIRSFLSLANAGDLVSDAMSKSTTAFDENSALAAEAAKRYATTESQLVILRNNLNDVGITLGSALLPAINNLVKAAVPLIERFADFAEANPKLVTSILAVGASFTAIGLALKGAAVVIGGFSPILSGLAKGFNLLTKVPWGALASGATAAFGAIQSAAAGLFAFLLANPIVLIIAAIVAAIVFLALAWKNNWFDIQGKTQAAIEFIGNLFNSFVAWIQQAWMNIQAAFAAAWAFLESVWVGITTGVMNAVNFIITTFNALLAFWNALPQMAMAAFAALGAFLWDFFVIQLPMALGFAYQSFINLFTIQIPAAWAAFMAFMTEQVPLLVEQFVMWFTDMANRAGAAVRTFFTVTVPAAIAGMVSYAAQAIPSMVNAAGQWFNNLLAQGTALFNSLRANIAAQLEAAKQAAITAVTNMVNTVVNWIQNLLSTVTSILSNLPGVVAAKFNEAKETAISIARSLYDGVREWISKVIDLFNQVISKAGEAISKAREAFSIGRDNAGRQFGGPVAAGVPYTVGEAGPETFVPNVAGKIIPNHQGGGQASGGGGSTVQFIIQAQTIVNSPTERRSFAEALMADLRAIAKTQGFGSVNEMLGEVTT